MQTDRLEALLNRFRVSARLFHSGPLCGVNDFAPEQGRGQLHLLSGGDLRVDHPDGTAINVVEPSLLFYPRPYAHRFVSDATRGADMACAFIEFGDGARNPLTAALPAFVVLPLSTLDGAAPVLDLLFREAFAQRCGRQLVVDRLFEVVLIQILRELMASAPERSGLFAGLAHPQLSRALIAMHGEPGKPWSLATLAEAARRKLEDRAQQVELLGQRPHPDAEDQPATAEPVQRPVTLGDLQRVVVAQDDHRGGQPDAARVGRQKAQRGQRIPVGDPATAGFGLRVVDRNRDVFGTGEVVKAQFVGGAGDQGQVGGRGVALPVGRDAGQLHHHRRRQSDPHSAVLSADIRPRCLRPGDRDRYCG